MAHGTGVQQAFHNVSQKDATGTNSMSRNEHVMAATHTVTAETDDTVIITFTEHADVVRRNALLLRPFT